MYQLLALPAVGRWGMGSAPCTFPPYDLAEVSGAGAPPPLEYGEDLRSWHHLRIWKQISAPGTSNLCEFVGCLSAWHSHLGILVDAAAPGTSRRWKIGTVSDPGASLSHLWTVDILWFWGMSQLLTLHAVGLMGNVAAPGTSRLGDVDTDVSAPGTCRRWN